MVICQYLSSDTFDVNHIQLTKPHSRINLDIGEHSMIILKTLHESDPQGHEMLKSILLGVFLDGLCYEFAIAVHNMTRWPIFSILHGGEVRHAFLKPNPRQYFDARGFVKRKDLATPFENLPRGGRLYIKPISPSELMDLRTIDSESVRSAMEYAEKVWPEILGEFSRPQQIHKFLQQLNALCLQHKVWIRSPFPNAKPIICDATGDEAGFEANPLATGNEWVFDRLLKEQ